MRRKLEYSGEKLRYFDPVRPWCTASKMVAGGRASQPGYGINAPHSTDASVVVGRKHGRSRGSRNPPTAAAQIWAIACCQVSATPRSVLRSPARCGWVHSRACQLTQHARSDGRRLTIRFHQRATSQGGVAVVRSFVGQRKRRCLVLLHQPLGARNVFTMPIAPVKGATHAATQPP